MSDPNAPSSLKARIRQSVIERRNSIKPNQRQCLDALICGHALQVISEDRNGQKAVAAYCSHGGEPNVMPVCERLNASGRRVVLPVLSGQRLDFHRFIPDEPMLKNRFGIAEPSNHEVVELEEIDWILMPLVAFSHQGVRLGMGGGFYDRTLEGLALMTSRPKLVGIAYSIQQVDSLPSQVWDVPLDLIVSDKGALWVE